jgi:pimeloyl-ACP methyl ester carboxylesterase
MKNGKTLFIIPGFKERISHKQYRALQKVFLAKGFDVKMVPIVWDRSVMTDWTGQFEEFFHLNQGKKNVVLGFSWGAMIALLTATHLKPGELILCSLSPYFAEDLLKIPDWWKRFIGKRRTADFGRYSMKVAVKGVSSKTKVFIGGAERKKFPQLAARCTLAAKALGTSVIVVEGVKHDIGDARYREALGREVS